MKNQGAFAVISAFLLLVGVAAMPALAGTVTSVIEDKPVDDTPSSGGVMPESTGGPDPFGYTFIDSAEPTGPTYVWYDISGTGTDMGLTDDSHFYPIALPFTFDFYGTGYTNIAVGSNGVVYFEDTYLGLANTCLPDTNTYGVNTFIAVYWDDLNPSSAGSVYYEIIGTAPDRRLVVQFDGVVNYGTSDPITVQAILFEGSNNILLQYADPSTEAGSGATVGIQGDPTTNALEYSCDTAALTADLAICFAHPGGDDPNCSATVPVDLQTMSVE
jgi:hypothetical protein